MENFDLKKYLKEDKLNEVNGEVLDRMEDLANIQDLKIMKDILRILSSEWMQGGFEKDEISEYLSQFIDTI